MRRAYKFRLYPSRAQTAAMARLLETHRRLYNDALAERKAAYETEKHTVRYGEQSARLKETRRIDPSLAATNFSSCQATLRRLDHSFAGFFRRLKNGEAPGYPRFKGRSRFHTVEFPAYGDGCRWDGNRVHFQYVGAVKIKLHRTVEGRIKTVSFTREADGWHVIFSCELPDRQIKPSLAPPVGIDMGLKSFLVTSDGETVESPRFYRVAQKKLRRAQRSVARKKKGGANRRKAMWHTAKLHQHVANQRKDFHYKTALSLVQRYGTVAHEDLNVQGIARTRLAKSTLDAGCSQFLGILGHKAAEAGVRVVAVNPANTTQTGSRCGCLPRVPLRLCDRVYHCSFCGQICDRDLNAARNALYLARTEPLGGNQEGCLMDGPRSPRRKARESSQHGIIGRHTNGCNW
jgi:putative transposase